MRETAQARTSSVESKIRRVARTSISEEIAKQIMDLIASGDLKPGQRLPAERELCEHFGASRSSLREALRCLSIVGVLNARVGDGTSVAPDGGKFLRKVIEWRLISEKHDIEDLLEVRIALEGLSAANSAKNATAEDIGAMRALLARMRPAIRDERRFAALDLDFHILLAGASGSPLLWDLVSMIRSQLARGLSRALRLPNAAALSLREHLVIFDAIERRDPEAARRAMQDHLEAVLERYTRATAPAERSGAAASNGSRPPARGTGDRPRGARSRP